MTIGELISILSTYNPDSELLIRRRFQSLIITSPYEAINYIKDYYGDLIIYEESDGS